MLKEEKVESVRRKDEPGIIVGINHDCAESEVKQAPCVFALFFIFGAPEDIGGEDTLESEEGVATCLHGIGQENGGEEDEDASHIATSQIAFRIVFRLPK